MSASVLGFGRADALASGADDFVGKPFAEEALLAVVGALLGLELTAPDRATPAALLPLGLTPREAEVLFWVSEGKTNAEIGMILDSAKRTVEKHVEHILEKLGVENRAAAIREALRMRGNGG